MSLYPRKFVEQPELLWGKLLQKSSTIQCQVANFISYKRMRILTAICQLIQYSRNTHIVLEEEVTVGIFNLKENPNKSCLWFKRIFSDLMEQRPTADSALHLYTDLMMGRKGLEFDMETIKILNHLKEARMPAKYIGYVLKKLVMFI